MSAAAPRRGLVRFVAELLAFTAIFFALWHFGSAPVSGAAAWIAARIAEAPGSVERVRAQPAPRRDVVFEVEPDLETTRRARLPADAVVDVTLNPLKHTFGLPFFLALMAAGRPRGGLWKTAAGSAVVLALSGLGLACELLVQLGSARGATGEPLFALGGRELIALGFQLGTLAFPTVVPAMLWLAMDRDRLLPQAAQKKTT